MQRSSFLRALSLCLGVLVGCGADDPSMAFPEDDAAVEEDGAVVEMDAGEVPSFDVPGLDRGNPTLDTGNPVDRGGPVDTGSNTDRGGPVDTGVIVTDRGGPVACPSSCGSDIDCNPCRTSSDPDSVRYCCLSGLCISMTGVCPSEMMMPGGTDGGASGDGGGAADAAGGTDAAGASDASGGGPG